MSGGPPQTVSPLTNALTVGSSSQQQTYRPIMLCKKFVFGARVETRGGVHYLDEFTVIWAAGKSVVVYNTAQTQHFIPTSDGCEAISCIAISNVIGGKRLVAVAEAGDKPLISIYTFDPNKLPKFSLKKTLEMPDLGSREFVSMCFSADGRYLATLGGYPEWNLVLWGVEKARHLATVSVVEKSFPSQDQKLLNQCSLAPRDPSLLCVSGNGILKFYRFADGQLRQSAGGIRGDPMNYLCHLWLPPEDRMIVSTDNGDLLYFENCEFKFPLPLSPSDGLSIDTLVAHSKGFVCGGDMGLVTIFERSDDKELYRKMRTLKIEADKKDTEGYALGEESSKVIAFSLSPPPGEENLALLTSNKQVLTLNLSNADFSRPGDQVCENVCQPFHSGPITGLDICIRKPLIATCGKDRNIILWNYRSNTVECSKHFPSEVLSIAIHPSGLHLIVGFPDKLRFMNIYGDDIREFRSYGIRSCTECRFSNGGQFFAAVTSTIIHVYSTYTCEVIGHLRGHNGKIKNIFFVPPDDTRILSVGSRERSALAQKHGKRVPLLVKIAPDVGNEQIEQIARIAVELGIDGLIATNTTISRPGLENEPLARETGGLSGAPLESLACDVLRRLRARVGPDYPLIGVGGICAGEDARARRRAGADLLQVYTGFIYAGPRLIAECAKAVRDR